MARTYLLGPLYLAFHTPTSIIGIQPTLLNTILLYPTNMTCIWNHAFLETEKTTKMLVFFWESNIFFKQLQPIREEYFNSMFIFDLLNKKKMVVKVG